VGVPTFKQSDAHTDEQLDAIAAMIDNVDWTPKKPDPEPEEPEPELPPAAQWQPPDEGATLDDETVEAIRSTISTLDRVTLSQVNDWAAEAHAADRPFSLSRENARTQRRFEIMRAAIALSPYEPDVQRAALGFVMGEEVQTTVTIGAALGSLTIDEAKRWRTAGRVAGEWHQHRLRQRWGVLRRAWPGGGGGVSDERVMARSNAWSSRS
jgi:hypothetical protein